MPLTPLRRAESVFSETLNWLGAGVPSPGWWGAAALNRTRV